MPESYVRIIWKVTVARFSLLCSFFCSICLKGCPSTSNGSLAWVCDYPEGSNPPVQDMDTWAERNYDYYDLLTPEQKNYSANLEGPCYPVLLQTDNCESQFPLKYGFALCRWQLLFLSFRKVSRTLLDFNLCGAHRTALQNCIC
jgi:hypothetical protein